MQLRGLISSISSPLVRASGCAKDCPVISRFSTSAVLLSAERRQAELKWAGRREMPAGFKLFMHFHHTATQCHVGSEHCSSGSQLPLCPMPGSGQALSTLQGEKIVAQGHGMSQQGGYFRNINASFNYYTVHVPRKLRVPSSEEEDRLAMGW